MRWSLNELYISFDSKEFRNDLENCIQRIKEVACWAEENLKDETDALRKIEEYIKINDELGDLASKLFSFAELTLSVEAKNVSAAQALERLENEYTYLAVPGVKFEKWLGSIENLEKLISTSPLLKEHEFYLKQIVKRNKYLLSEKEEMVIARMKNTGSNAWSKLQKLLTSTLLVDINVKGEDKRLPLPVVRNLAYDKDPYVRKSAYEAELESYKKIEESSAACLNGIKGEVITLCKLKGYNSPLEKTLIDSRMDMETLNAMLEAIKESLPQFRKYYRKKAELLGHKNGLPFYDMFAPMGDADMMFTYNEARDYIVKNFAVFSQRLSDFAKNAFDKNWIDAEPREGKRGGAFCSNLHSIKESRILANFTGSFSNMTTLAHELGHGYHGDCLKNETYLNSDYPMPIAETASIFCETIIKNAALKDASKEEAFAILENDISDSGQVIVDIYSRFLFESELFRRRDDASLSVNELKKIMINAQIEAYGDGIDSNYLHPYMWVNKPHYYYAEANFYNFPYAFGLLFAKGLYAEYLMHGSSFVPDYDRLLSVTGSMDAADVASTMGIDIRSKDFWKNSLKLVEDDIDTFVNL